MDSKNYYQVLSSLFGNSNRQGQGRPQRQAAVSAPFASSCEAPVDSVCWSKGLFRAINEDLAATWAI